MKFAKILASVSAAVVAVTMLAASVFAAETKGSITMSDSRWWTQKDLVSGESGPFLQDFLGDVDANRDFTISFEGTGDFIVGYNDAKGKWKQPTSVDNKFTLTKKDLPSDESKIYIGLILSNGNGESYTITWTITGSDIPAETEAPAEETAAEETTAAPAETEAAPVDTTAAPAETEAAPVDTTAAPAETEAAPAETVAAPSADGVVITDEEATSAGTWGQAITMQTIKNDGGTFDPSILSADKAVVVYYEADTAPEVVLQSWSGGEGWAKVPADEELSADGMAVFTYEYMTAMYGDDFETLDAFIVGDTGSALKVTKVVLVDTAALNGEAAAEEAAPAAEETAPAAEEAAPAVVETAAPSADSVTAVTNTGNTAVMTIVSVMALAGAAAVAARKRK